MWIALLRLEYLTPVYRLLNVRLLILKKKQKKNPAGLGVESVKKYLPMKQPFPFRKVRVVKLRC